MKQPAGHAIKMIDAEGARLEQPELFDLELEILRWVKQACLEPDPPLMQKPAGNVIQYYGLDSKSRWREAVCVMMIYSEPAITPENLNRLGHQLAKLFRQDIQLWDVKAKQLKSWVDRGLINVKLLDRTLAYFQNQSSYLQYIKTLKRPVPRIESPGFPGTQWSEYYWKDQTVMLLMLESDFPDGKNPDFCASLFREEPGVWKLKMEQFKRWLEKGKNDPLPEYYGTGKNCSDCGVFLFDTKSYLKHMKRNHGYKIKEKDKQLLKSEKREKQDQYPTVKTGSELKIPTKAQLKARDPFDSILTGSLPTSTLRTPDPDSDEGKIDSDLDETTEKLDLLSDKRVVEEEKKEDVPEPSTTSRRRAISKPEFKDEIVSCPECGFQCLHSKIVSHLKRCTKKMAQAKNKTEKKSKLKSESDQKSSNFSLTDLKKEPEVKKPRESEIVKKVFLKKFEAQQKSSKIDYCSDSDVDVQSTEEEQVEKEKPSLKLKFSRKESSSEASHFEVSNDNLNEDKHDDHDPKDTSLSAILRNLNSDRSDTKTTQLPLVSPPKEKEKPKPSDNKDDSSDDEVIPQKSFRLHSFIESLRAMQARLPQKKEENPPKIDIPDLNKEDSPVKPLAVAEVSPVDSANLKNKWLQSLENRNKVKPQEPTPVANKIQTDIALLKDKNSLIYSKAKLKSYPENLPKLPLKEPQPKAEEALKEEKAPVVVKERASRTAEKVEYHDARPSLRKGKMIPCPICGSEYAIADNLQKHIDKDHFGETDRVFLKRVKPKDTKEKEKIDPPRKKKKISSVTAVEEDEDDLFVDLRPTIDNTTAEEKFDSLIAGSFKKEREKSPAEEKLTEYEIFQKLQLKETSKTEKKKVECKECGMMLPVNTIKRHLLKHEKEALREEAIEEEEVPVPVKKIKPKAAKNKKVSCSQCKKLFPPHTIKRHETKCKKEIEKKLRAENEAEKKDTAEFVDDRIPCPHCSKMFPKLVMKRHLMKHETVSESSDADRADTDQTENEEKTEKVTKARKKVNCGECGMFVAPNVFKRHVEKHSKIKEKSKSEDNSDMFAPIEITPTKEYWEFEKEKNNKSLDFPSESDYSAEEGDVPPYKKIRKDPKKNKKSELINKPIKDVKEAEKSRHTSEEESESENPLEAAVRKVVSYRMTPKQALSHYNLTPKVLFDNLLGETDDDRMSILGKVNLEEEAEMKVIGYCRENETQLSYKAVISLVKDLKISSGDELFSLSRLEAYRWWYAFRKKHDLKITAKKK